MMEADMFSGVIIGSWRLKDADYKWGSAFSPRGLLMCGTSCRSMSWSLLPSSCSRKDSMIGARMWNYELCLHPLPVTSYKLYVCLCVVAATCSVISAFSSLSETKVVAQSPDILHVLIISFAFIDPVVSKLSCLSYGSQLNLCCV